MRNVTSLLLASILLLSGCAVGPDYQRPLITSPERFRGDPAGPDRRDPAAQTPSAGEPAAPAASIADHAWWDILKDKSLERMIDEALVKGYDVRLAAARIEEARANAGIAKSEFLPQIQGAAGWSRSQQSEFITPIPGPINLYDVNLGLSWEIDLWGRIRRLNEAALARYLATEEARRGVLLSLVSDVATGYFQLRALDLELEIAERTTASFRETHDLFSRRLEAGTASPLETSSAAASLATTAAAVPELKRRIAEQENRIAFLLGHEPGDVPRGDALVEQLLPPEIPAGIPSDLLRRRPDLRQAEQELVAANAEVGVAVASFFPSISLTAAFGGVAPKVTDLFGDGKTWSAGAGLLTPLYQGRRLKNQHRAALARWEQAKILYERSVNNAFTEVSTALVAYQKLADVERELDGAVTAYKDAVQLANARYLSGLSDYLEVLQAQRQLFPAELALTRARFERLAVLVQLYRALGGGWQVPDEEWAHGERSTRASLDGSMNRGDAR